MNRTPYAAERTWVRDTSGQHLWLVAVKASFEFDERGALRLANEQPAPLLAPVFFGEPNDTSIRFDAEVVNPKPTTDVIVNATARAPGERPVQSVEVTLRVADRVKSLIVHGPRFYHESLLGLSPTHAEPFIEHPIIYEWAFGGHDFSDPDPRRHRIDMRNPVGRGGTPYPERWVGHAAHRVEYPGTPNIPAGFGAVASHWSPRLEWSGTYDSQWNARRRPLLPLDYDDRSRQSAPADQWPAAPLVGGERIQLQNMTHSGSLSLTVPRTGLELTTHIGSSQFTHPATLGTITIEPDAGQMSLVWQSRLVVEPTELDNLDITVIRERSAA